MHRDVALGFGQAPSVHKLLERRQLFSAVRHWLYEVRDVFQGTALLLYVCACLYYSFTGGAPSVCVRTTSTA